MNKGKVIKFRNSVLSIVLFFFISFSCILFSACTGGGTGEIGDKSYFEQYVDSFKVVYSNSLEGMASTVEPLTNVFFEKLLKVEFLGLAYYYGSADFDAVSDPSWFPDSIRMLVINEGGNAELISTNSDNIWNWTFLGEDIDNNESTHVNDVSYLSPSGELYETWKDTLWEFNLFDDKYSSTFTNMYLLPLKIVMYEILLGYEYEELTTFAPAISADLVSNGYSSTIANNQNMLVAKIVSSSGEGIEEGDVLANEDGKATVDEGLIENENVKNYITYLSEEYKRVSKYTGFTKDNADLMVDYILNEVIGSELVDFDYINYGPGQSTYRYTLQEGVDLTNGNPTHPENYNYLVYDEDLSAWYDYYNYRNYVGRVANIIFDQTYDGDSGEYVYSRDMYNGTTKIGTVEYDHVKANGGVKPSAGGFTATAATYMNDFENETFLEQAPDSAGYTFGNSPKAEYQSIVVMPASSEDFIFRMESGMLFNIMAYNRDLAINIRVRYCCYENNECTMYEFIKDGSNWRSYQEGEALTPITFANATEQHDTVENTTGYQTDFEASFDLDVIPASQKAISTDRYKKEGLVLPPVSNTIYPGLATEETNTINGEVNLGYKDDNIDDAIDDKVITAEIVNESKTAASYYKIIDSVNGYGGLTVLDESKMNCTFFEVVFDVVKSPDDPDISGYYDFKINIAFIL